MTTDGIDVSQYQGVIDWEKVKGHIDFAIIRCGYGQDIEGQDDRMFKRNADECTRLNIPFGVYLYSYATNEEEALSEARHAMRLIKDYKMSLPIYYDLEDPKVGRLSNEQITNNARVFCEELRRNNYLPGVYANLFWWTTKLTDPFFENYSKWIASYNDVLNYDGVYDIWQYSQTGFIEGIDAYVDLNISYKDFMPEILANGLNNFAKEMPVENYQIGDHVTFEYVFISSDSTMPLIPYMNHGTITRIQQGARNPYLIGEGLGWVTNETITGTIRYLSNSTFTGDSLVDALKEIGVDPTFETRRQLAILNGIDDYVGSGRQNHDLLTLLKEGRLKY